MKKLLTLLFVAVSLTAYAQPKCGTTPVTSTPIYKYCALHPNAQNDTVTPTRIQLIGAGNEIGVSKVYTLGSGWTITNDSIVNVGGGGGSGWSLTGNAGTNPATDFIGTTDAQDLNISTNSISRIGIASNGDITIPSRFFTTADYTKLSSGYYSIVLSDTSNGSDPDSTNMHFVFEGGGQFFKASDLGRTIVLGDVANTSAGSRFKITQNSPYAGLSLGAGGRLGVYINYNELGVANRNTVTIGDADSLAGAYIKVDNQSPKILLNNAYVGIGVATPTAKLQVVAGVGDAYVLKVDHVANINETHINADSANFYLTTLGGGETATIEGISSGDMNITASSELTLLGGGTRIKVGSGGVMLGAGSASDKLDVDGNIRTNGNIYISTNSQNLILKSPSGDCWKVQVDDVGNLTAIATTCP